MNVSSPLLDVVPGPRGLLLTTLARLTDTCTGRSLAAQAGVPTATTARILADLIEAGVVTATPAGRATLYALNREHLTAKAITELAGLRFDLVNDIKSQLKRWHPPAIAGWLFGSTARGDGDRQSDIDLLLVGATTASEAWQENLGDLADRIERRTGNPVQVVEHTRQSFRALDATRSPLTKALRVEGIELVDGSWSAVTTRAS
jgi:predicted nucleotidyltransferase